MTDKGLDQVDFMVHLVELDKRLSELNAAYNEVITRTPELLEAIRANSEYIEELQSTLKSKQEENASLEEEISSLETEIPTVQNLLSFYKNMPNLKKDEIDKGNAFRQESTFISQGMHAYVAQASNELDEKLQLCRNLAQKMGATQIEDEVLKEVQEENKTSPSPGILQWSELSKEQLTQALDSLKNRSTNEDSNYRKST